MAILLGLKVLCSKNLLVNFAAVFMDAMHITT